MMMRNKESPPRNPRRPQRPSKSQRKWLTSGKPQSRLDLPTDYPPSIDLNLFPLPDFGCSHYKQTTPGCRLHNGPFQ